MAQSSHSDKNESGRKGRCLALYPGAFRPPHKAHFLAVQDLVQRPDVDEVVVIVTNRLRPVPGTGKVLDCDMAVKIWEIYLREIPKARVVIAQDSAVAEALSYFSRVGAQDRLIFSVGESDFSRGDRRFRRIERLSAETGIDATVLPAPTGGIAVRATELRHALALGASGYDGFRRALPDHLTEGQSREVWDIARAGMVEAGAARLARVRLALENAGFDSIEDLAPAGAAVPERLSGGAPPAGDEALRFACRGPSGEREILYAKYAKDTVEAARLDKAGSLKPRGRLSVERRAIRYLRGCKIPGLLLPDIRHFDKAAKLLVLSRLCPQGTSLEADLESGRFDPARARRAGDLLARLQDMAPPGRPLWGSPERELAHWRALLARRCGKALEQAPEAPLAALLEELQEHSDGKRREGFFHLNYLPKNILFQEAGVGLIDLEFACGIGDPALDPGWLLGRYLYRGQRQPGLRAKALAAAKGLIGAYCARRRDTLAGLQGRITAFAGACLALDCAGADQPEVERTLAQAGFLLKAGLREGLAPEAALDSVLS
jgi:nicotinic acid mononucleotide adenylyltransferase